MKKGAANNISEKLALASRNARALPGSIAVSPTETDRKIARAVLQTLHDNITPEMLADGYDMLCGQKIRYGTMKYVFQAMIQSALKGERA